MELFFKSDYKSFRYLNATQFFGALNDNVFKFLIVYFLISIKGAENASIILALAGAIFVLPFLFLSSTAGVLADKFSKTRIIVVMKVIEVIITLLSLIPVSLKSVFGSYLALFFLAVHSTLFNPPKYGIIPELVEEKEVPKANGSLTSLTYLAIIVGTFLASFLTEITGENYPLTFSFCVLIAIAGFFSSLGIKRTPPKRSRKMINPIFLYEIYKTLKGSLSTPYLLTAITGSAFFLMIGGFTQINIIPFALQSLHLTAVEGGYLFLVTALGIVIGAKLAGFLSQGREELALSAVAGIVISFFFIFLKIFSHSLVLAIINLFVLGVAGGVFLVPFDTFIQLKSPEIKRGQVIAANSFLSFVGVLIASFLLWVLSALKFKPSSGFVFMGVLTFLFSIFLISRTTGYFWPYFARNFLSLLYPLRGTANLPAPSIIIYKGKKKLFALSLFSLWPNMRVVFVEGGNFLSHFHHFYKVQKNQLADQIKELQNEGVTILIIGKDLPIFPEVKFDKIKIKQKIFRYSFSRRALNIRIN